MLSYFLLLQADHRASKLMIAANDGEPNGKDMRHEIETGLISGLFRDTCQYHGFHVLAWPARDQKPRRAAIPSMECSKKQLAMSQDAPLRQIE